MCLNNRFVQHQQGEADPTKFELPAAKFSTELNHEDDGDWTFVNINQVFTIY